MRWTEKNPDIHDINPGELWVGVMENPRPHVVIAARSDEENIVLSRFDPAEARQIGEQLIRFAHTISAPDN